MARLKGLVLEVGDNWALILSEQGEYKKIKTKSFLQVGEIWQESTGYTMKYAVAAAVLLVFLGAAFTFLPVVAYAQVSSGIELGLNRWEWVVSARPLNDDGRKLLQELNLQGKTLDQAVELIVDNTLINNSNSDNKEIVLNVVTRKPGDEQDRQRIMEKMDTKVKQILERDKLKHDRDTAKDNSGSEPGSSHDEVESKMLISPYKDKRFKGDEPVGEFKGIKTQPQIQHRNTPDKDIDEVLTTNVDKDQKIRQEDATREIIKEKNPDAIKNNDKPEEKNRGNPEKETLKSSEKNNNAEENNQRSNGRRSVKEE